MTSGLPRGVRDTICYKIVFEVTDDEACVVAVQFAIRDPAGSPAVSEPFPVGYWVTRIAEVRTLSLDVPRDSPRTSPSSGANAIAIADG